MRKRKAIIIGAGGAGKTALFNALGNKPFTPDYIASTSIDSRVTHMPTEIEMTKVYLVDVAGNNKYVPLLNHSLKNLDIVLLVINIHKAFEEQKQYLLTLIKSILSLNILRPKFLMVTTHNDLTVTPVVSTKQIDDLNAEIQKKSYGDNVSTLAVSAKTGENIGILHKKLKLTVDIQNTDPEELDDVKKNMERIFNGYISFYKCSLFGHHHNGRARYILNAIKRAETVSEIHIILETQLTLFNTREHNPTVEGIFKKIGLDSRWTQHLVNKPAIPDQSGYYQTILRAKDFVNTVSPPGDFSLRHKHFSYC